MSLIVFSGIVDKLMAASILATGGEESGLGDEQGWLPTDRATLQVKGHERIYALGDATDLPVSKSGSAAHLR